MEVGFLLWSQFIHVLLHLSLLLLYLQILSQVWEMIEVFLLRVLGLQAIHLISIGFSSQFNCLVPSLMMTLSSLRASTFSSCYGEHDVGQILYNLRSI